MTILNLLDIVVLGACLVLASGCGKDQLPTVNLPAPTATQNPADTSAPSIVVVATATPTAVPTMATTATPTAAPNPTTVTYIFQNILICNDIKTWDPNTTTIKTYPTVANGPDYYLFRWDGVWFVNSTTGHESVANRVFTRSSASGVVCTITVTNGQLVSVTP